MKVCTRISWLDLSLGEDCGILNPEQSMVQAKGLYNVFLFHVRNSIDPILIPLLRRLDWADIVIPYL